MDEKDFGKLIASFLRGESSPASTEDTEETKCGKGENPKRPRGVGKSLLESLMERADVSQAEREGSDARSEEIALGKDESEAAKERDDSHYTGIGDREVRIFEPESPLGAADESSIQLKEAVSSEEIAVDSKDSPTVAGDSGSEESEMALPGDTPIDLEADRFGSAEAQAEDAGAGEPTDVSSATSPRSFGRLLESISTDLAIADVALSTADGLSIASAGAGDAEALAACVPDLLRALKRTDGRVALGKPEFAFIEARESALALAPVGGELFLIVRAKRDVGLGLLIWTIKRHLKSLSFDD